MWLLLGSDRTLIRSKAIYGSFIFFKYMTVLFKVSISIVFYMISRSIIAEMSSDYDHFTAVNIYFMLGLAHVYNNSDHCIMAILVGF